MVKENVFIADEMENNQRHLEESRSERERSRLDMVRLSVRERLAGDRD